MINEFWNIILKMLKIEIMIKIKMITFEIKKFIIDKNIISNL